MISSVSIPYDILMFCHNNLYDYIISTNPRHPPAIVMKYHLDKVLSCIFRHIRILTNLIYILIPQQ